MDHETKLQDVSDKLSLIEARLRVVEALAHERRKTAQQEAQDIMRRFDRLEERESKQRDQISNLKAKTAALAITASITASYILRRLL